MKILDRWKGWFRSRGLGLACDFCREPETGKLANTLFEFEDVLICRHCMSQPMCLMAMDMFYWAEHPEEVPPCRHCGMVVSYYELEPLFGWYLCGACSLDDEVILYWKRVYRRLMERRSAAIRLELKKLGLGAGTP